MDSDKIDELAAIAYEAFSENNMFTASPWRHLDSIHKDAWRRVAIELVNKRSLDNPTDSIWCSWTIEAGDDNGIGNSKYCRMMCVTEKERHLIDWRDHYTIKNTMAHEYVDRLIKSGVQWVTLTWQLGSK